MGKAGETAEMAESLIGLANAVYRAETDAVNDSPAANVILGCLGELVEKDDWYELRNTYGQAFDFSEQQGPNVDALSKDRLRTLIHDLDVVDRKDRKIISGGKDTVYYVRQEKVSQVDIKCPLPETGILIFRSPTNNRFRVVSSTREQTCQIETRIRNRSDSRHMAEFLQVVTTAREVFQWVPT